MCGNETGDMGGKMGEVKIAVGGTGDTGIVRRNGRQVRMREIDGRTGPVEPGVKGNLTFAYKHVWPATSGVSPVGLDGEPENAADCA
jgi:hypothetical protein